MSEMCLGFDGDESIFDGPDAVDIEDQCRYCSQYPDYCNGGCND